jgi:eukaryotic-like serine/threonine-protein kinase
MTREGFADKMNALLRISLLTAAAMMLAAPEVCAATGDWPQYGFTAQERRENTHESILNRKSVTHLVPKWSISMRVDPSSAAAVANGIVYLGSSDHHVYALDAKTGAPVWNAQTGGAVLSSPAVVDGVVYVGSDDRNIYAFDAETGAIRWTAQTGTYGVEAPVAVARGVVYAGTLDHRVLAIDAKTGVVKWTNSPSYESGAFSAPSVADGVVSLTSGGSGTLDAFDATSGVLLWTQSLYDSRFACPPATYKGMVFVNDGSWLWAFDAKTGQTCWSSGVGDTRDSAIALAGGHIYLEDVEGGLDEYGAATGVMVHRIKTGQPVHQTTPAVANGVMYTNANGPANTVSAYNTSTGKLLWQQQSTGIFGVPTVANGMLYVGSGSLFTAYGLP